MQLICKKLLERYAQLNADCKVAINGHYRVHIADELKQLANVVSAVDKRDNYGRGGSIALFEQQLSQLFGFSHCAFLPTGTLAQCAALKSFSEHSGRAGVALHPTSHLLLHEHMAMEQLWGLQSHIVGLEHQVLTADDVMQLDPRQLCAIVIELPMREIGGGLPSWNDLVAIRAWCTKHGVQMHMDGARVWQVTEFYQRELADIASLFDSVYVSFYKDLAGISGAALLGSDGLISASKIWARRAGGNPVTLYPQVISARHGLTKHLPNIPRYVEYAQQLALALQSVSVRVLPATVQTAMFHLQFRLNADTLAQKIVGYAELSGILVLPLPRFGDDSSCVCEVTVGERTTEHPVDFWITHIKACIEPR